MRSGANLSLLNMKQEKLVVDFTFNTINDSIEFANASSVDTKGNIHQIESPINIYLNLEKQQDLGLDTYEDTKNDQIQTAEAFDMQDNGSENTQRLDIFVKEEAVTKNRVLLDEIPGET